MGPTIPLETDYNGDDGHPLNVFAQECPKLRHRTQRKNQLTGR